MKRTAFFSAILLLLSLIATACEPSAQQSATMTAAAWTPTSSPTPTDTPTPIPTATSTPEPPTATPTPSTGRISGRAYWVDTNAPVEGVKLTFKPGGSLVTDAQGNYFTEVDPGAVRVNVSINFTDLSTLPCPTTNTGFGLPFGFKLLGDWEQMIALGDAQGFTLMTGQEVTVEAGEELKLDLQFSCQ